MHSLHGERRNKPKMRERHAALGAACAGSLVRKFICERRSRRLAHTHNHLGRRRAICIPNRKAHTPEAVFNYCRSWLLFVARVAGGAESKRCVRPRMYVSSKVAPLQQRRVLPGGLPPPPSAKLAFLRRRRWPPPTSAEERSTQAAVAAATQQQSPRQRRRRRCSSSRQQHRVLRVSRHRQPVPRQHRIQFGYTLRAGWVLHAQWFYYLHSNPKLRFSEWFAQCAKFCIKKVLIVLYIMFKTVYLNI